MTDSILSGGILTNLAKEEPITYTIRGTFGLSYFYVIKLHDREQSKGSQLFLAQGLPEILAEGNVLSQDEARGLEEHLLLPASGIKIGGVTSGRINQTIIEPSTYIVLKVLGLAGDPPQYGNPDDTGNPSYRLIWANLEKPRQSPNQGIEKIFRFEDEPILHEKPIYDLSGGCTQSLAVNCGVPMDVAVNIRHGRYLSLDYVVGQSLGEQMHGNGIYFVLKGNPRKIG